METVRCQGQQEVDQGGGGEASLVALRFQTTQRVNSAVQLANGKKKLVRL